jgi:uncharacterized protein involved in exopolysaccharide biosynthesis
VRTQQEIVSSSGVKPAERFESGFSEVLMLLKWNRGVVAGAVLSSLLVGAAYLWITPAQYTATALLLIDSRSNVLPSSQMRAIDANSESAYVETQVGVLRSERIARLVISEHRLHERPEFQERPSLFSQASAQASVGGQEAAGAQLALELLPAKAVREFGRRMGIKRSQSTHIIDISFTHEDPQLAAVIANAIAQAYLNDRLSAREEAIRTASTWLQQRALDLRRQTQAAQTALDEFRNSNAATGSSRSVLRDLESTAQTYRLISESFHKRFLETSQEQYFSPLDARIVSEAWTPAERSQPRRSLVLAIAAGFGLAVGCLIALLRGDGRKHPISSPAQRFSPLARLDRSRRCVMRERVGHRPDLPWTTAKFVAKGG